MTTARSIEPAFVPLPRASRLAQPALWPTKAIVYAPLIAATVLAKFAPPIPGITKIGLLFPVVILALCIGLLSGRLRVVPARFAFFLMMLSMLALVQVWRGEVFSMGSLAMMTVVCFAYVPAATAGSVTQEDALRFFCNLSFVIAVAGILQFCLQFIGGTAAAFPIEHFLPDQFRTHGYNDMAVLRYGSHIYKATGFVMLEPSVFCQLVALGLTAELVNGSRSWRLLAYAGAIVISYSGTGLLILAVTLPLLLILHRRWDLMLRGVLVLAVLAVLAEPLNLNVTLGRIGEFSSSGSSGFQRFVGWMTLFSDKLWSDPQRALLGYGSGSFFDMAVGYKAGEMAHAKIIFEFGVLGGLLYFGFVCFCLLSSRAPLVLRAGMLVAYFMNAAYSPSVTGFALTLLLWPAAPAAAGSQPEAQRAVAVRHG